MPDSTQANERLRIAVALAMPSKFEVGAVSGTEDVSMPTSARSVTHHAKPGETSYARLNPKIFTPARHSRPGPPIDNADCVKRVADTRPLQKTRAFREAFRCQFLSDCC
jgi:hypothetical protein